MTTAGLVLFAKIDGFFYDQITFRGGRKWTPTPVYLLQSMSTLEQSLAVYKSRNGSKLDFLLESMPENEKYGILLQSFSSQILEESDVTNTTLLTTMTSLFNEMIEKAINPSTISVKSLIDASSKFRSCEKLGEAMQLSKAGGVIKAFGVGNSILIEPIIQGGSSAYSSLIEVPKDDREQEVIYASIILLLASSCAMLQGLSFFDHDLSAWATFEFTGALSIATADIVARSSKGIKLAKAGLDRLVLRDRSRELHSDAAAFLVGYLLGLPCFCYKADISEALRMFLDHRIAMESYRQPLANSLLLSSQKSSWFAFGTSSTVSKEKSLGDLSVLVPLDAYVTGLETDAVGLGRVLVWLMAPVAAEVLKYGQSIMSDPRRSDRFLGLLMGVIQEQRPDLNIYKILPKNEEDRKAVLRWAYNEAVTFIKQNGDVLEILREYMETGTTTVGECALLIEKEMQ